MHVRQLGDVRRLPAAISKEIQRRIIRRPGDSDPCVGHSHLPLGFGNVRAPLQQIRRQPGIQRGRLGVQFLACQVKVRGGFSNQHGNPILKLFSLLLQQDGLCACGIQERLFLCDVKPGRHTALVALIHELETLFQRLHGAMQDPQLLIELPQREIVAREFRRDHQSHVF